MHMSQDCLENVTTGQRDAKFTETMEENKNPISIIEEVHEVGEYLLMKRVLIKFEKEVK